MAHSVKITITESYENGEEVVSNTELNNYKEGSFLTLQDVVNTMLQALAGGGFSYVTQLVAVKSDGEEVSSY